MFKGESMDIKLFRCFIHDARVTALTCNARRSFAKKLKKIKEAPTQRFVDDILVTHSVNVQVEEYSKCLKCRMDSLC